MIIGTVKWFNETKGYGFISPENSNDGDVFVHINAVKNSGLANLAEGQKVSFEIEENRGKSAAVNLKAA